MSWTTKLIETRLATPQLVNDSKTPSGKAHIGALRGPLIHDAIFQAINQHGGAARYIFGSDDYDPLDEIPFAQGDHFAQHLGKPLCDVPNPFGGEKTDIADHYISNFFSTFARVGIRPETYRVRDIYRSGQFDEAIDIILRHAHIVRKIYHQVSNAQRPENWLPFQPICESCGRIGTTEATAYDGKLVTYNCRPNLVKWATGCGHSGQVSPFGGRGKLPWKLEWTAKWRYLGITIEGAGKDHSTKGGSRDVAMACLREIFQYEPPLNIPYEFFLVGGAKMSSSKGIGASASDMCDFLPSEILRYLMLKTPPQRIVNFLPDKLTVVKLYNDFDRDYARYFHDPAMQDTDKDTVRSTRAPLDHEVWFSSFQLLLALLELPHLDPAQEMEKRKIQATSQPFTDADRAALAARVASARYWLDRYASEEDRLILQPEVPPSVADLAPAQRVFLHRLAEILRQAEWEDEALQREVFHAARVTPIPQAEAFQAIYRVLFDRASGPKAGSLIAFLDRDFIHTRLTALPADEEAHRAAAAIPETELHTWTSKNTPDIAAQTRHQTHPEGVTEWRTVMKDGKTHVHFVK